MIPLRPFNCKTAAIAGNSTANRVNCHKKPITKLNSAANTSLTYSEAMMVLSPCNGLLPVS